MLGHGARSKRRAGSRRDIDLQCLLRSIATPITTEPSARLPLPSSLICLSCSFLLCRFLFPARIPFSRLFPRRVLPHSLAITNTVAAILSFFSLRFSSF